MCVGRIFCSPSFLTRIKKSLFFYRTHTRIEDTRLLIVITNITYFTSMLVNSKYPKHDHIYVGMLKSSQFDKGALKKVWYLVKFLGSRSGWEFFSPSQTLRQTCFKLTYFKIFLFFLMKSLQCIGCRTTRSYLWINSPTKGFFAQVFLTITCHYQEC